MLDIKTLEAWLWDAACGIRGAVDAPKYKDYILPLVFVKRLSDVFEDELQKLTKEFGSEETAWELVAKDHSLVRFYIPREVTWPELRKKTRNIGQEFTDAIRAIAKENKKMKNLEINDFTESLFYLLNGFIWKHPKALANLTFINSKNPSSFYQRLFE